MKMSNKLYDILKDIALIVFPAVIVLCSTLFAIWGCPYGEQIVSTLAALEVFLGAILKISNAKYKKTT